jgi:thiamine-monophosphate kinase
MSARKKERTLSDLGETEIHARIRRLFKDHSASALVGCGDDGAVVRPTRGSGSVLTTDFLLEGVHFPGRLHRWYELGYKCVMINSSDVVAMGGKPEWFLSYVAAPARTKWRDLKQAFQGMRDALKRSGGQLVGGDVDEYEQVVLGGTMVGRVSPRDVLRMEGASPDDTIYVTGTLGDSALGCRLLSTPASRRKRADAENLVRRHLCPPYRGDVIDGLRRDFKPTALTDLSDGLARDLRKLCRAGGVGAHVNLESLPISVSLFMEAERLAEDPRILAAIGGEDYELLFTSGVDSEAAPREVEGIPVTPIGRVTRGRGRVEWFLCGDRVEIEGGFRHFKG